jgi:phenylacetate-coenzyme A ligase PaaK-like adenylate-forming protein
MAVLNRFSEKEYDYHIYQTRQNYLREQKTIQLELEEALREKEAERQAKEAERQAKEEALHENESMKAELAKLRAELDQARKK